ncbi:hypothetical protein HUO13_22130 [Saccharopolyspora erythraea]|uniref:hypothetical protein n=1 Tax=Saccharopolyspora erythraea TaxID=1836 RepID=UPI001BA63DE6|nr:hypothetical protein [Saccharopolyspora erythraea]QUH03160.1 hypothetical protein HUO13_22130 [Saccharopolyspora erythraea]
MAAVPVNEGTGTGALVTESAYMITNCLGLLVDLTNPAGDYDFRAAARFEEKET